MERLWENLTVQILTDWPAASIFVPGEAVLGGWELVIQVSDNCFISIYQVSDDSCLLICAACLTEKNRTGYRSYTEYEISATAQKSCYKVHFINDREDTTQSVNWSAPQLAAKIKSDLVHAASSGRFNTSDGIADNIEKN